MTGRLLTRLSRLTTAEARWRLSVAGRGLYQRATTRVRGAHWNRRQLQHVLRAGAPGLDAARAGDWLGAHRALSLALQMDPPRFVIGPSLRRHVAASIAERVPVASSQAKARAGRVADGAFDLLGYAGLRFGAEGGAGLDWHLDPVHARRAPLTFWSSVPFLDPQCGDHKIIWELNRHQHLLVLGRAYWLTGDARFRQVAVDHIVDWIARNPPLIGINWASMLELGFRSISWLWAMHLFASPDPDPDERPWLVDTVLALDRQLRHIEQNLSHYFSPNTHLLGEALALYVAGRSLTWLARSEVYADTGRRILVQQIAQQIAADGGHLERSTHYQRYTLDFYVLALAIARITQDDATCVFEEAVARLAAAATLLSDDNGWLPHIGDDDGGQLFPMCGGAADNVSPSLAVAAALTGSEYASRTGVAEEALWMLAHPSLDAARSRLLDASVPVPASSGALPETGYYVSRSPDSTHLVFDAGAHGFANGGHAHADALSFTLSVRGVPLFIDTGTGSYTADASARDRFRSSALHNTVTVDGRSQSIPAGPFHWSHVARARAERWRTTPAFDYIEGAHDGYAPVTHRRHLLVVHGDLVVIADVLEGDGEHRLDAHWHLAPRWAVTLEGRYAAFRGPDRLTWATSATETLHLDGTEPDGGGQWSPVYGQIEPTNALRSSTRGRLPLWMVSAVSLSPDNDVLAVSAVGGRATPHGGIAVRILRSHGSDLFVVAPRASAPGTPERAWSVAGITSDAHMVFARIAGPGGMLAMVDGASVSDGTPRVDDHWPEPRPAFHAGYSQPERRRSTEPFARPFTEVR